LVSRGHPPARKWVPHAVRDCGSVAHPSESTPRAPTARIRLGLQRTEFTG
jgi:hypothetical protein